MDRQKGSSTDYKRMSLDKIFSPMTAEFDDTSGCYVQFGVPSAQNQSCKWNEHAPSHMQYMNNSLNQSNLSTTPSVNPISSPFFVEDIPQCNCSTAECIYFPSRDVAHLGINKKSDVIQTIDIGGGNFINVIYGNTSQFMAEQCQHSNSSSHIDNSHTNQEYELFDNQQVKVPLSSAGTSTQNSSGKQLIDNLLGNWVPNQSGTYSPFGGSSIGTSVSQSISNLKKSIDLPKSFAETKHRKPRIIAEIKPMRPSYSDVLIKSIPASPPSITAVLNPNKKKLIKKPLGKSLKNREKRTVPKFPNSSASDENSSPKILFPKKSFEKFDSNLSRRWVSLDNISSSNHSSISTFDRSNNFEKKKSSKFLKKETDKQETLNNFSIQNNSTKIVINLQKCPIQINNNLNTIDCLQTGAIGNKVEKNKQANNKTKEDKKHVKDKSFKHVQAEKLQQMKKNQRNRKKENRESAFKGIFKIVQKYSNHWSKIVLQVLFWLLHLISDVFSMSINLMLQFGKCCCFYMTVYIKCLWIYMLFTASQIRFLNGFGKIIDGWFGKSRLAFWRRFKTKVQVDESTIRMSGLEANIFLPSTGEEAMKRLLACKGKDPYCILGVTPTCTDDDIKKYYKRQAFLVHPDKNNQPGAEEAFKILVHAFDIIGEPERRQAFDQTRQVEAAWGELNDLISQLHRKMEQAANTIRCTNCGLRHKRIATDRPCYAARFCTQCKIRHGAKEGDIWAESRFLGFLWHYYACMEGGVYDVTDWAACQASNLKHLKANAHIIQYRIVLGQRPSTSQSNPNVNKKKSDDSNTSCKTEFEDFLQNLYKKTNSSSYEADCGLMRSDNRRRKTKRRK